MVHHVSPSRLFSRFSIWPYVLTAISLAVFWYYSRYSDHAVATANPSDASPDPQFTKYEHSHTRTYHMVCLTNRAAKVQRNTRCWKDWYSKNRTISLFCRDCLHPQKLITVYDDSADQSENSRHEVGFDINFKKASELPSDYTIIEKETAYFMGKYKPYFEPCNFYHFTKELYFPLFWLMKSTNQLHKGAQNVVFYPGPYALCDYPKVIDRDINRFKYFRDILHIRNGLESSAYIDKLEPHKVCYKNAVFSKRFFLEHAREAISYFKNSLHVKDDVCEPKTLTIMNRSSYRRILNADDLVKISNELGYNTKLVAMETMSWKEQAQLIHCTSILVGVTGAGLQWAFFMKNNSGVVEIAWPNKEWFYFFAKDPNIKPRLKGYQSEERDVIRPLKFVKLNGTCVIYPPVVNIYAKDVYHRDLNLSYEESLEILKDKRNYDYAGKPVNSVGKLCDVMIDKEAFRKAVIEAGQGTK